MRCVGVGGDQADPVVIGPARHRHNNRGKAVVAHEQLKVIAPEVIDVNDGFRVVVVSSTVGVNAAVHRTRYRHRRVEDGVPASR